MDTQRAAEIQAVLEGVDLPARKSKLIDYAREQDASVARDLQGLPEREYARLDEVGELLAPAPAARTEPRLPRPESGAPPGGPDYLTPFPADTGRVQRDRAEQGS
jgi:hypothetical protein